MSATAARAGADVQALTLGAEKGQQFGGLAPGAAKPVRGASIELSDLAGLQDEVVLAEP